MDAEFALATFSCLTAIPGALSDGIPSMQRA
jgi:hypothetical protein